MQVTPKPKGALKVQMDELWSFVDDKGNKQWIGSISSLPIPNCPHPLTPSPKGGEGEPNRIEVPLPFWERDLG